MFSCPRSPFHPHDCSTAGTVSILASSWIAATLIMARESSYISLRGTFLPLRIPIFVSSVSFLCSLRRISVLVFHPILVGPIRMEHCHMVSHTASFTNPWGIQYKKLYVSLAAIGLYFMHLSPVIWEQYEALQKEVPTSLVRGFSAQSHRQSWCGRSRGQTRVHCHYHLAWFDLGCQWPTENNFPPTILMSYIFCCWSAEAEKAKIIAAH